MSPEGIYHLRSPKEGKGKAIPISEPLRELLDGLARHGEYVLERIHAGLLSRAVSRIIRKARLDGTLHTLRHFFEAHLLKREKTSK